ncbi:MAG TPA: cytochrome C [Vicinamibacteria bacterium]
MAKTTRNVLLSALLVGAALLPVVRASDATGENADTTVALCDGQSVMTIPGLKAGEVLPPERARVVAGDMLQVWARNAGEVRWASWKAEAAAALPAASSPVASAAQATPPAPAAGQPMKATKRDLQLWGREEKKWMEDGYKAFHNAKALGGTIGISCDMCHPDATNTHPETYPKYQMQTKKVALLRDMINWCIENPMKGKPLAEDDANLRAVEAYILSARKGVALESGKH